MAEEALEMATMKVLPMIGKEMVQEMYLWRKKMTARGTRWLPYAALCDSDIL